MGMLCVPFTQMSIIIFKAILNNIECSILNNIQGSTKISSKSFIFISGQLRRTFDHFKISGKGNTTNTKEVGLQNSNS